MLMTIVAASPGRTQVEPPTYSGMCYRFKPENTALPFLIWRFINQFGRRELRIAAHPQIVCVPGTIRRLGPYPEALLAEPAGLLACFFTSIDIFTANKTVRVRSQFGANRGTLTGGDMFCMPSLRAASAFDDYMCYDFISSNATRFSRTRVTDLFGRREVVVRAPPNNACVRLRIVHVPEAAGAGARTQETDEADAEATLQPPVQLFYTSSLDPVGVVGERLRFRTRFGLHTGVIDLPLGPFVPSSIPASQ
jgi:hypothetical protein